MIDMRINDEMIEFFNKTKSAIITEDLNESEIVNIVNLRIQNIVLEADLQLHKHTYFGEEFRLPTGMSKESLKILAEMLSGEEIPDLDLFEE